MNNAKSLAVFNILVKSAELDLNKAWDVLTDIVDVLNGDSDFLTELLDKNPELLHQKIALIKKYRFAFNTSLVEAKQVVEKFLHDMSTEKWDEYENAMHLKALREKLTQPITNYLPDEYNEPPF